MLPGPQKRNKQNMRFFVGTNAAQDYRSKLAERATAVGDKFVEGFSPIPAFEVPLVPVPLFPEDRGARHNQTHVLLCDFRSIFVDMWRRLRIESDREISQGVVKAVVTLRFDVCLSEPDAGTQGVAVGPELDHGPLYSDDDHAMTVTHVA